MGIADRVTCRIGGRARRDLRHRWDHACHAERRTYATWVYAQPRRVIPLAAALQNPAPCHAVSAPRQPLCGVRLAQLAPAAVSGWV